MRFSNRFSSLACILALGFISQIQAQTDELATQPPTPKPEQKKDSTRKYTMRLKVDGVASVVGEYVILDSDIDKALLDLQNSGYPSQNVSRCELLGKLMEDKLYAHNAIIDSVPFNEASIKEESDRVVDYILEQAGGDWSKILEFYGKEDEEAFRNEILETRRTIQLSSAMQSDIVNKVEITPEEVRKFFDDIPEEERPLIGTELELSQIVIEPKVSKAEEQKTLDFLKQKRQELLDGNQDFFTAMLLYSEDPGSRANGGIYTLNRKRPQMVKEFREMAFSLREGEISEPFRTSFGWHILKVEKIRGQQVDVRHILRRPEISAPDLNSAKQRIDSIRGLIVSGELTFSDAAKRFSDDIQSKSNDGKLINPATFDTHFELTKMDPNLYSQIVNLKDDEITLPILEDDPREGKKYKIMMITNRFEEHIADFSKDYIRIKDLALKDKQLKAIQKWLKEKIEESYVYVNPDYRSCQFTNQWIKN